MKWKETTCTVCHCTFIHYILILLNFLCLLQYFYLQPASTIFNFIHTTLFIRNLFRTLLFLLQHFLCKKKINTFRNVLWRIFKTNQIITTKLMQITLSFFPMNRVLHWYIGLVILVFLCDISGRLNLVGHATAYYFVENWSFSQMPLKDSGFCVV